MSKKATDSKTTADTEIIETLYTVTLKGLTPLVLHNADVMIKWKGIDKGSDKAEWEHEHVADMLYVDPTGRTILPMANLKASIRDACKFTTTKPKPPLRSWAPLVDSALIVMEDGQLAEQWAPFAATVGMGGRLNIRWRPRFLDWSSTFGMVVFDPQLTLPVLEDLAYRAGRYVGIGDGLKIGFGRYKMEILPA